MSRAVISLGGLGLAARGAALAEPEAFFDLVVVGGDIDRSGYHDNRETSTEQVLPLVIKGLTRTAALGGDGTAPRQKHAVRGKLRC